MIAMARKAGLEPATVGLELRCSSNRAASADGAVSQLRTADHPVKKEMIVRASCRDENTNTQWPRRQDSNLRSPGS